MVGGNILFQIFNFRFKILLNQAKFFIIKSFRIISRMLEIEKFSINAVNVCLELLKFSFIAFIKAYQSVAIVPNFLCFFLLEIFILDAFSWPIRINANHKISCRFFLFFRNSSVSIIENFLQLI